ncbi:hypothetical protein FOL47_000521 [Perkinsus chesapeaki]|uniref:Uncharacterized protein n=1 Tax=Perkinsus chesapeaki TaxID=330153 RepID=A0A7J6KWF3_PERCH|nr:hypothetical protein FOL47_000521 [Perkinsus chesapeaki]
MSFIDDYWGIEPDGTVESAFDCWIFLNEILGFREKKSKRASPAEEVPLLGLNIGFSRDSMTVTLPSDKRDKLASDLESLAREEIANPADLRKLCGRLTFASATSADYSWRSFTRSLYRVLNDEPPRVNKRLRGALRDLASLVRKAPPSKIIPLVAEADHPVVLYSDAESDNSRITGVLCFPTGCRSKDLYFAESVPETTLGKVDSRKNQIAALELYAARVALIVFDNKSVEDALVRGSSAARDLNHMIGTFWKTAAHHSISVWVARVPSLQNLADGPSRHNFELVQASSRVRPVWPALNL